MAIERMEVMRCVLDEVARLPEAQRRAIALRYIEGLSTPEIARREQLAASTVRATLVRALAKLRERLDARFGGHAAWSLPLAGWALPTALESGAALTSPPLLARARDAMAHTAPPWPTLLSVTALGLMKTLALTTVFAALAAWLFFRPFESDVAVSDAVRGPSDSLQSEHLMAAVEDGPRRPSSATGEIGDTPPDSGQREAMVDVDSTVYAASIEDRATGLPIEGATISRFTSFPRTIVGGLVLDVLASSNAFGILEVELDGDSNGDRRPRQEERFFVFHAPGYGPTIAPLTHEHVAPNTPRRIRLGGSAGLSGQIHGAGLEGLESITIELLTGSSVLEQEDVMAAWTRDLEWRSTPDASGRFEFVDLPSNAHFEVSVRSDGRLLWHDPEPLRLLPGESRTVDWKIGAGSTIRARATEETGGPAAGIQFALDVLGQRGKRYTQGFLTDDARTAVTDEYGIAIFQDVTAGSWWLGVRSEQPRLSEVDPTGREASQRAPADVLFEVDVTDADAEIEVPVTIYRGYYISGRLFDWKGSPFEGYVSAWSDELGSKLTETSRDGEFRIGPLRPGAYTVTARARDNHVPGDPLVARTGDRDVRLQLVRGSSLEGRIVDRDTGAAVAASTTYSPAGGLGRRTSTPAEPGRLSIDQIRPGPFSLLVKTTDGRVAIYRSEGLEPGETREGVRIAVGERTHLDVHYGGAHKLVFVVLRQDEIRLGGRRMTPSSPVSLPVAEGEIDVEIHLRGDDGDWALIAKKTVLVTEGDTLRVDIAE